VDLLHLKINPLHF